jgi:hypothetical protein
MDTVRVPRRRREIVTYVPAEVIVWVDRKAQRQFKSRSGYLSDLLVTLMNRDRERDAG